MKKDVVRVGYIGLGRRGSKMMKLALAKMQDVEIVMICDLDPAKLEEAQAILREEGRREPIAVTDYRKILQNPDIDAVLFFTGWEGRLPMVKESMRAGKYTAMEVGCAETLEECMELVDIYEETGVPVMMLENICYGKRELMALNLVKQGLFGEIVHCAGGYCHYLNDADLFTEIMDTKKGLVTHYRLGHYIRDNCENYPTHELGPIAKCLGLNRGNRMLTLSSFSSKSCGLRDFAKTHFGEEHPYANTDYRQGDLVHTIITCAGGETILLTLDTTLPRPYYSRQFTIRGTKGMCYEDGRVVYFEGMPEKVRDNEEEMMERYAHPLHREVARCELEMTKIEATFGLHSDGVDWMIFRAFIESVKSGQNTPIDAYDTASWLAIGPLSRMSIKQGGAPVEVPDFTRGKWRHREPVVRSKYCLDEIVEDDSIGIYDSLEKRGS